MAEMCWLCKVRPPEKQFKLQENHEDVCSGCFDVLTWYSEGREQRQQGDLYREMVRRGLVK